MFVYMKKFPKVKSIGHRNNSGMLKEGEIIIKEKLDGANFRFTVNKVDGEYKLFFGSRNVVYKIGDEPDYEENVDSRFKAAIKHVRDNVDPERVADVFGTQYTFFGENMVKHSLEYDWDNTPQFIGFDIYNHDTEEYLSTESAYSFFNSLGLETAPIIARMDSENFDPEEFDPAQESEYRDGAGEGVVIINTDMEENDRSGFSTRAKMVTEEFEEKHDQTSDSNHQDQQPDGHTKIANKYATDARIKKHVHKMRDEGYELGMHLMNPDGGDGLFMRVVDDIMEEEYEEIARSSHTVDFKELRNTIAGRCAPVLKSVMQGEAA